MFCPHCHNKDPGRKLTSAAVLRQPGRREAAGKRRARRSGRAAPEAEARAEGKNNAKPAYTKGSRPRQARAQDKTPMIIAIGLILILVLIIVMIVRSMFRGRRRRW